MNPGCELINPIARRRRKGISMGKKIKIFCVFILVYFILVSSLAWGTDDTQMFQASVQPDVLFLLDCSGSMAWDPTNNYCYTTGCSKMEIAKQAIFQILDDNMDGTVNSSDENSLKVRFGFMRFVNCYYDENGDYRSGCNMLVNEIGSSYSSIWSSVQSLYPYGGTPSVGALGEAKLYLNDNKASDPSKACRQKYVILISDGSDTYSCYGDGMNDTFMSRKGLAYQTKALSDAGYNVFVVGFGANMPVSFLNTLNWMAYLGGTDNPNVDNSGDPNAITTTPNYCMYDYSNDPANFPLSGYAFIAGSASELNTALKSAMNTIREGTYLFSSASVAATRALDENYLYAPAFLPKSNEPFWRGYLKRYTINSDGSIPINPDWEAGAKLAARDPNARSIYTIKGDSWKAFTTSNITPTDLGLASGNTSTRNMIVGFFRGESTYNKESWKLGDVFHSTPVTVGRPSLYYNDSRSPKAFSDFRATNTNRPRLVFVGANDGQLHAFNASDGEEKWSLIPPNLLPKLQYIVHSSHPTNLSHYYFVDGPITAADVWLGSGTGTSKSASEWKTLLIFGEGKGPRDSSGYESFLWSSSQYCDSDFGKDYSSSRRYYCGYYALDMTDTSAAPQKVFWTLTPNSTQAKYMDEPWSRMGVGKVLIDGNERWVGFIGGGYNTQGKEDDDDQYDVGNKAKGFFVVDLQNGNILWSYTRADNSTMYHSVPGPPTLVDSDNDGFIDTVYIANLGGDIWRLRFCTYNQEYDHLQQGKHCGISDWAGSLLFHGENNDASHLTIFNAPAVSRDLNNRTWILWGTGDKMDPNSTSGTQNKFFAVIDSDRYSTYQYTDLQDITAAGMTFSGTKPGWYIKLTGSGEKVLSDPTVFGGIAIFASYTPASGSDPCGQTGTGKLYSVAMMPVAINGVTYNAGAGVLSEPADKRSTTGGNRNLAIGAGIPTSPFISQQWGGGSTKPTSTNLFLSVSGGAGVSGDLKSNSDFQGSPLAKLLQQTVPSGLLLHWKDQRAQ